MFAKNRTARLAAALTLLAGTAAASASLARADDVIVQPDGKVVKPMPKWKQRKLERKIQKLTGGDVVVEGTPTVPVRPRGFLKPILPRRDIRVVTPAPSTRIIEGPAPIVTNTPIVASPPIVAEPSLSTSSKPIYSNQKPIVSNAPIVTETPVTIGTPIVSTPSIPQGAVSAPVTGPDSSVNPARNVEPVPAPAEVVPPPAGPVVEPALEPIKSPRDSA